MSRARSIGKASPSMNPNDMLPWDYPDFGAETRTKEVVQAEMEDAVKVEDYERAAMLRDELKAMA